MNKLSSKLTAYRFFAIIFLTIILLVSNILVANAQKGVLDVTFGNKGKVVTPIGSGTVRVSSMALQNDGKILVFGGVDARFLITRYNVDGTLDSTFGIGGVLTDSIAVYNGNPGGLVQQDNKILLWGMLNDGFYHQSGALIRYNTDGSRDSTFGIKGIVKTASFNSSISVRPFIRNDKKILITGLLEGDTTNAVVLMQFNQNGSVDSSFKSQKKLSYKPKTGEISGFDAALSILPDGKILTMGLLLSNSTSRQLVILRAMPDGSTDSTFGINGVVKLPRPTNFAFSSASVQNDLKIIISGIGGTSDDVVNVIRLNSDGSYDSTFGGSGIVVTKLNGLLLSTGSLHIQPDNKIVIGGSAKNAASTGVDSVSTDSTSNHCHLKKSLMVRNQEKH